MDIISVIIVAAVLILVLCLSLIVLFMVGVTKAGTGETFWQCFSRLFGELFMGVEWSSRRVHRNQSLNFKKKQENSSN